MIINALLNAMVQLLEVMLLTIFCLCIFALFALEVYMGKLHQVCVLIKGSETSTRESRRPSVSPILPDDPNRHFLYATQVTNLRISRILNFCNYLHSIQIITYF
jgi:hypothetical protein